MPDKKQYSSTKMGSPLARRYSGDAMKKWGSAIGGMRNQQLPSMYTPISDQRNMALEMMTAPGQAYAPAFQQFADTLGGKYLDPTTNPYFNTMVDASVGRAMNPLLGMFNAAGMGAGRSTIGANVAADAGSQTAAGLYGRLYDQERNRMMQATQMLPMMDQAQYADAQRLGFVGSQYEEDIANQQREDLRQYMWPAQLEQMYTQGIAANPLSGEQKSMSRVPFDWMSFAGGLIDPVGSKLGGMIGGMV